MTKGKNVFMDVGIGFVLKNKNNTHIFFGVALLNEDGNQ